MTTAHGPGSFVDCFVCEDAREQAWKDISIIAALTSIYGFERLTETYCISYIIIYHLTYHIINHRLRDVCPILYVPLRNVRSVDL